MEAFSHFTYHQSGDQMIVCDLQGRHRNNKYKKSRFELSDPAICSRRRSYVPTDLGEQGIENFFVNHHCNEYCQDHWTRPWQPRQWFPVSHNTSMLSSRYLISSNLPALIPFEWGLHECFRRTSTDRCTTTTTTTTGTLMSSNRCSRECLLYTTYIRSNHVQVKARHPTCIYQGI